MAQFDPSQPFSPVDEALFGAPTPSPASPSAPVFDPGKPFTPVPEPTPAATPPAPSAPVTRFDPAQDFSKVFSLDEFRAKPEAELLDDKAFHPVEFGFANQEAVRTDPEVLEKLTRIYKARETKGTTLAEKGKAVLKGTPEVIRALGRGAKAVIKKSIELNPVAVAARVAGAASGAGAEGAVGELKKLGGEVVEIPASVESATAGSSDLARRGAREVIEGAGKLVGGGKAALTPQQWRERFFDDVAGYEQAQKANEGRGAVLQALSLDSEKLKEVGVELRPEVIQDLSVITDPINFIPVGSALGVVTKIGGKLTTRILANTATAAQATKLATALNGAALVGKDTAGSAAKAVGGAVEKAGIAAEGAVKSAGGAVSGAGLGALLGQNIYSALGGAAVVRGVPKLAQFAGKAVKAGGEILKGERAAPGALKAVGATAKQGALGFGEGLLLGLPFELGARPEEEEVLLGAAGVGGLARAGLTAAPRAARSAGTAVQNALAQRIFKQVEQAKAPESATYGTEPTLDTAHSAASAALDPQSQKLVSWTRELFRDSGVEVYALDNKTFKDQAGTGNAFGYSLNIGEQLAADGTTKPLIRIFLNKDVEALPHELFHALDDLDPAGAKALKGSVMSSWTPEQKKTFSDIYNFARNDSKPEAAWTHRLSDEGVASEAAAEVFSRLYLNQDLTGVTPDVRQRAALFLSGVLEKLGAPLGGVGKKRGAAGVSTLGVRPGVDSTRVGQAWIQGLLSRLEQNGDILPEAPAKSVLTGREVIDQPISQRPVGSKPVPAPPKAPAAPTPAPVNPPLPIPAVPKAPAAPKAPRNIRTTPGQQNDFASRRADDTGISRARDVAGQSGEEVLKQRVNEVADLMESGNPVLEIEHSGVKNVGSAEAPSDRTTRRAEQEAAYIQEGLGAAPESVRDAHQKTFVPVRWEIVGGEPQLLAMSLDKVIANVHRAVKDIAAAKLEAKIPYEVEGGKLTEAGWNSVVQDLQSYTENQSNGYRGDGQKLNRPAEDVQQSLPAENPSYNPVSLSEAKTNFLNLIQGLAVPFTARETKGRVPGNVKGQVIAKAQGRQPETPSVIRPQDITKQTFKSGETLAETNPLRNELAAAGVPVRELIEVTERINAREINSVKPRSDLNFKAPVTDIIRGGFLPGGKEFFKENSVEDIINNIQSANAAQWTEFTTSIGGLTGGAFRLGLNLKDKADVTRLKQAEAAALKTYQDARAAKDFETLMPAVTKKQFFTEALEVATGSSPSKQRIIGELLGDPNWKPPFPMGEFLPASKFPKDVDPIETAAIRTKEGYVVTGTWHGDALQKLMTEIENGTVKEPFSRSFNPESPESAYDVGEVVDGFVTRSGKFLDRDEAYAHAESIKQIDTDFIERANRNVGSLESTDFKRARKFLPKVEEDASGALPGNELAKPNAPIGSVGKGFQPPEAPRPDNTALALPVEGVDSSVRYAGDRDGLTPARFLPKPQGSEATPASPSYPDADRLARERKGNAWVRQSDEATNKDRVLLVQFTPDLMYPNGPDPVSTPYYDKLYSGARPGYARGSDFWELPQWVAVATENLGSKADFYAVRNMDEAKKFLEGADYGRVAFSVMDVSKAVTEELVPHIKGQVDLGGYTDRTGAVAKNPNAKIWNSMNEFIESMGIQYRKGFDYRHFRGTEIIPRLELSAGCRHRCTFCTIDRKVTNSPLEEINAQVDSFSDLNAKLVYLNDKTFGQSPNVAEMPRIYKEMKEANPEFEGFVVQTTAAQMKIFTDKFLQDSGIKYVELGVETYNDPILKELRKPATEKLIDEAVEKLRRNKINFIPNIVIGFPGETAATYARTMDFLNRNADIVSHLNTYNLAIYEGTEISKSVKAKTASDADENSFTKSFYADPKIHEDFAKSIYDYGTQQLDKKAAFLPKTEAGKAQGKRGVDIEVERNETGSQFKIVARRDDSEVGELSAYLTKPAEAYVGNLFVSPKDRRQGIAEALYRELGATLSEEGVTKLRGNVISPDALRRRVKVFPGSKIKQKGNELTPEQAEAQLNENKFLTDVVSPIEPGQKFLPGKFEPEEIHFAKGWISPSGEFFTFKSLGLGTHDDFAREYLHQLTPEKTLEQEVNDRDGRSASDELYRRGWLRFTPFGSDSAMVNSVDGPPLSPRQRRELLDWAKSSDGLRSLLFDNAKARPQTLWSESEREEFLPKRKEPKRDAQGRPLKRDGSIDFERWRQEEKSARPVEETDFSKYEVPEGSRTARTLTGWILPNQQLEPLDTNYHEQFLAENASRLNRQFGTKFSEESSIEDRLAALNKGFVRVRANTSGGGLNIELNSRYFKNPTRKSIEGFLSDRADDIDTLRITILDDEGQVVDSTAATVVDREGAERADALLGALDELRPRRSGQFLPGESDLPLGLPSEQQAEQIRIRRRVQGAKQRFPEAIPLQYAKDENGYVIKADGKPRPIAMEYGLADSPLAREAAKGLRGSEAREAAIAEALGKALTSEARKALKNPEVKAGEKWYSTARTRLRKLLGDDSKFFAELLGATSARTPVETNFAFAVEAYNNFKLGKYDEALKKYRAGKSKWETGDIKDFIKATGNEEPTRGQFLDWWVDKHDLKPRQSNGKLFGANSRSVLRVLDGSWASEVQGPKTPNFAGNLSGLTFEATIDVWAARMLHRLANEGSEKPWRILPENETGVTDADFFLGQAAFRHAAEKLGIKPDSLQAILWFAEKGHWEERGWTRGAGAEKSDFNSLISETERTDEGTLKRKTPQVELAL